MSLVDPWRLLHEKWTPSRPWRLACTRPGDEFHLAAFLRRRGIAFLLPWLPLPRGGERRPRIALVDGIVFLRCSSQEGEVIVCSGRVRRILPVADQDALQEKLEQLAEFIREMNRGLAAEACGLIE